MSKFKEKHGIVKASKLAPAQYTRTGFIRIDDARSEPGRLGLRHGSVTIIYGQTGAGKSSLTYQIVANIQRQEPDSKPWLIVDVENSFDPHYAEVLGVDLDRLDIMPIQQWFDEALEGVRQAILSNEYAGIVVDSIHGQATARDDKSMEEEKSVGALPMKITQFIQTTKGALAQTGVMAILIGQARDNMDKYGDAIHLTGGNALRHDSDLTIQITRSDAKSRCEGVIPRDPADPDRFFGHVALVKIEKCRGRGMGKRFSMPFIKGEGFSEHRCLIEEAAVSEWGRKIFDTSGHHFKWRDSNNELVKLNGKAKLLEYFSSNDVELQRLQEEVLKHTTSMVDIDEPTETIPASDSR